MFKSSVNYLPSDNLNNCVLKRFFSECDGVILNANADFEQPAIDAWKSWFIEKPVISPGPTEFPLTEFEKNPSSSNPEVTKFLDAALEKHGERSVFYVR